MVTKLKKWMRKALTVTEEAKASDDGFSMIELLFVIAIMALLTTVVVINVMPSNDKAMVDKAKVDISRLDQAIEMYRMETQRYPTTDQGLDILVEPPKSGGTSFRKEGIIKDLPADPWGNPYQYLYPGEHGTYDIFSFGADGRLGGEGLDADIGNWKK